jgi:apolipoprotein N-acyltransferase
MDAKPQWPSSVVAPRDGATQMPAPPTRKETLGLSPGAAALWAAVAVAAFHLAFGISALNGVLVVFLYAVLRLSSLGTGRQAFYAGLVVGLAIYAPRLAFFWTIFGPASVALWLVLAFWLGLFVALARGVRTRFGPVLAVALVPCLWTGVEYFRSELYFLRFSWLSVGYAFSEAPQILAGTRLGVYGLGFVLMGTATVGAALPRKAGWLWIGAACAGLCLVADVGRKPAEPQGSRVLRLAGMQLEFPAALEVPLALDELVRRHPDAEVLVLSEYTFDEPVPERVKAWCKRNRRFLVAGGKDPVSGESFRNTVFVVSPDGEVVFRQAKSVPIQFFRDGLPAATRELWKSPWGKVGFCVCYDLSYRRVMDEFVREGAEALIVPVMDVADWGEGQHQLHARIGPVRAAEYGLPIFRVCSSGISQRIDATGVVRATAPFPGQRATIAGSLRLAGPGRLPLDRYLAPCATGITGLVGLVLVGRSVRTPWAQRRHL